MTASSVETPSSRMQASIQRARAARDDVAVMLVANLKEGSSFDSELDRSTEYFDESELDEITTAIRSNGFYAGVFIGEDDFMRWALGGGARHFHKKQVLVYSTAQSGTGPGRKSLIPSFCSLHAFRTLGSDAYVVSLSRHKPHVNAILRANGVPAPDTWTYDVTGSWVASRRPEDGVPVLIKSCFESASIGITKASAVVTDAELPKRLKVAARGLQQPAVVQRFIAGREYEVPVIIDDRPYALHPVGISLAGEKNLAQRFLDYETVATNSYEFYDASGDPVSELLRQHAETVAELIGISGFGRVDFRVDERAGPYVTDVSTSPHLVSHSAYGFRMKQDGLTLSDLIAALVGNRLGR